MKKKVLHARCELCGRVVHIGGKHSTQLGEVLCDNCKYDPPMNDDTYPDMRLNDR